MNTIIYALAGIGAFVVFCTIMLFFGWVYIEVCEAIERWEYKKK